MSFGNGQSPRPRGNCGCLLFLVIVGVAAFLIFGQGVQIQPGGGPGMPGDFEQGPLDSLPNFEEGNTRRATPEKHPEADDWDMQDVKTKPSGRDAHTIETSNKKSTDGEWSIEEVETDNKDAKSKNQFDVSNPSKQPTPESKSTKKGDWEFEEVDKK